MTDVEQMKKIVPLIACEIPFCHYVCKLVFGVDILDLNLGIQINSVKQLVKSNSVGFGYVSHCWTSAFDDQFNHSSKKYSIAPNRENFAFDGTWINIAQITIVVLGWNLGLVLGVLDWCGVTRRVSSYLIFGVVDSVWWRMKHFKSQIPKIKSWCYIHA